MLGFFYLIILYICYMQKETEIAKPGGVLYPYLNPVEKVFVSAFGLKETVYLKTDIQQKARLISAIKFKGDGGAVYSLACGMDESEHYDFEISETKDILIATL